MDYNQMFKWCVEFLRFYAAKFGMTYEEINIWIFVIIEPIAFVLGFMVMVFQTWRILRLKARLRKCRYETITP